MCLRRLALVLVLSLAGSCAAPRGGDGEGLLADVGAFHRTITTRSAQAQHDFDQGLLLCYGFDHEQATRRFQHALELDPACASAWWGIALAAGPNINNPTMDDETSKAAFDAVQQARALAGGASEVERALIEALARRYVWPAPADRKALDVAYADAMREVWRRFPHDADVGALFSEALMDLRPWDLWTPAGAPQPETPEILGALEAVLAFAPDHPGANHNNIHSREASPHPELALASADRLRTRVPGASHLVHMPAHIDIRLGHYREAIEANQRAIVVDRARTKQVGAGGFYTIYRAHNYHFLAWAAMFDGQSSVALEAAREMVATIPTELARTLPQFIDGFMPAPLHVMVRFGKWEEILREPRPPEYEPTTLAFWHYARGIALSTLGRVDEAAVESRAFEQAFAAVPDDYLIGNNPSKVVLGVARPMLEGELEYRRGNYDKAFACLEDAVALDDALHYDEPWGWMQPARHALGALLLEQGRVAEAEAVYRRDLVQHPENGWALHGLHECLVRAGNADEAASVQRRYEVAWARADVQPKGSCYCRTK